MAAVSGETSAPEPVERRGDRGGRQTLRRKSRRTERWREMETGLTECEEEVRWKRERRGVVKKIGWVNLGEPGIFHQYSFTCLHGSLPTFSAGD